MFQPVMLLKVPNAKSTECEALQKNVPFQLSASKKILRFVKILSPFLYKVSMLSKQIQLFAIRVCKYHIYCIIILVLFKPKPSLDRLSQPPSYSRL